MGMDMEIDKEEKMTKKMRQLAGVIDNTLLKQDATLDEVIAFVEKSIPYNFASVCINPFAVKQIHQTYGDKVKIATVIGFPNGISVSKIKAEEAKLAVEDGADEIDFVINVAAVKAGDIDYLRNEMNLIRQAAADKIVKCIIETCFLNDDEIRLCCNLIEETGIDFVKTSTGFAKGGATVEHIRLIKSCLTKPTTKIKASGGVRDVLNANLMIESGADRIGTSNGIGIVEDCRLFFK